jgi:hypothetical protein
MRSSGVSQIRQPSHSFYLTVAEEQRLVFGARLYRLLIRMVAARLQSGLIPCNVFALLHLNGDGERQHDQGYSYCDVRHEARELRPDTSVGR